MGSMTMRAGRPCAHLCVVALCIVAARRGSSARGPPWLSGRARGAGGAAPRAASTSSQALNFLDVGGRPRRSAVDGELCGFADAATPRLRAPTAAVPLDAANASVTRERMRRFAAHLLAPWRDAGGITAPSKSFYAPDGARTHFFMYLEKTFAADERPPELAGVGPWADFAAPGVTVQHPARDTQRQTNPNRLNTTLRCDAAACELVVCNRVPADLAQTECRVKKPRAGAAAASFGPGTIEVVVADGAAWVRDEGRARRRPYEQARADFVVGLANRLAPTVSGAAAFTLSTGDCVATRRFDPVDAAGCGRRPRGTYAPWQANPDRRARARNGPVLAHVACLDSPDVPVPFFMTDGRAATNHATSERQPISLRKRRRKKAREAPTACNAALAGGVGGAGELAAWDDHARALCAASEATVAARDGRRRQVAFFRGGGTRSCWNAVDADVGRDDNASHPCGRGALFRGPLAGRLRAAGLLDAMKTDVAANRIPLEAQAEYAYLLSVEGHCGFADRAKHIFWTGSTLFHQESFCEEYYVLAATPWVHYVPVAYDYANLEAAIAWAKAHKSDVENIARNARAFASAWLSSTGILAYFSALLAEIADLTRYDVRTLLKSPDDGGFPRDGFRGRFVKAGAYLKG